MTSEGRLSVELYVRSLAPRVGRDRLERTVQRLDALEAARMVSSVNVRVTGDAIPATPADAVTEQGTFLSQRVRSFEDWADRTDRSLLATFERRPIDSAITGRTHAMVAPPALALAEFIDGTVRFVSPCLDGDELIAVADRLAALEAPPPGPQSGGFRPAAQ